MYVPRCRLDRESLKCENCTNCDGANGQAGPEDAPQIGNEDDADDQHADEGDHQRLVRHGARDEHLEWSLRVSDLRGSVNSKHLTNQSHKATKGILRCSTY